MYINNRIVVGKSDNEDKYILLDKANIKYKVIDAEDNKELTYSFGIKKAPTLLVPNGSTLERYENVSFIKKFVEEHK